MRKKVIIIIITLTVMLSNYKNSSSNINIYGGTLTYGFLIGNEIPGGDYSDRLEPGISFGFSLFYVPPVTTMDSLLGWRYYFFDMSLKYLNTPFTGSPNSSISWYSGDLGLSLYYPLFRYVYPYVGLSAGGFYSKMELATDKETANDSNILFRSKTGIILPATSSLSFKLEGSYSYYNLNPSPFISSGIYLSASYNFSGDYGNNIEKEEAALNIISSNISDIFAIRNQEYNTRGVGTITLKNTGEEEIYNIQIDVTVEGLSGEVKSTEIIKTMEPGDVKLVLLPTNLSSKIFSITEDRNTMVNCKIIYSTTTSRFYFKENIETRFYNKNAIMWNRTEHLGSFIMPLDITIQSFAKRALGGINLTEIKGIPRKLLTAMVIFDALRAYGITYVNDPQKGYSAAINKNLVDYVQLPAETLWKKAGDCDDLTALYASMLEGVGINTAIATTPGHVFLAFNTGIPEYAADEVSLNKNEYILLNGHVWVPVEVTMMRESFVDAWKEASRNSATEGFDCIETAKAWEEFPPADSENEFKIIQPEEKSVAELLNKDLNTVRLSLFDERILILKSIAENEPGNPKHWNNLGIIYGKFYHLAEAETCFLKALKTEPSFFPSLTNIGNISMLNKNYNKAVDYYQKSLVLNNKDIRTRINLARALYELRKYTDAKNEYKKAFQENPGFAARFSYLEIDKNPNAGARAFDITERNEMNLWIAKE